MISKGHNFRNVNLVVVLGIDGMYSRGIGRWQISGGDGPARRETRRHGDRVSSAGKSNR